MAKQIFDQARPRSTMAQQLDEAFAGCEEWTIAPARRRSTLELAPSSYRAEPGRESQPGQGLRERGQLPTRPAEDGARRWYAAA